MANRYKKANPLDGRSSYKKLRSKIEAQAKEALDALDFMGIPLDSHDCPPGGKAICCRFARIVSHAEKGNKNV